jgi:hypothetical protein
VVRVLAVGALAFWFGALTAMTSWVWVALVLTPLFAGAAYRFASSLGPTATDLEGSRRRCHRLAGSTALMLTFLFDALFFAAVRLFVVA